MRRRRALWRAIASAASFAAAGGLAGCAALGPARFAFAAGAGSIFLFLFCAFLVATDD